MLIDASKYKTHKELNDEIKKSSDSNIELKNLLGNRYIGDALKDKHIKCLSGIPGNALGAYMDGATIEVFGNTSDATGDTMNDGEITIHGNAGDTCGYAMRGGEIYVRKNTGYRSGIHMKSYEARKPVMVIGNKAGAFLAEYMAGGYIIVLGLDSNENDIVGDFSFKGMYGGKVYIRGEYESNSDRICIKRASDDDISEILPYLKKFSLKFDIELNKLLEKGFSVITPNTNNPFKALYVAN